MFKKNQDISKYIQDLGIRHLAARKATTEANECSVKWFGLEAEIEVMTRKSEGEKCYFPGDYVSLQFISAQDRNTVTEINITDNNDGSYEMSFISSEAGQQLPTVKINGEIIDNFPPIFIKERSFLPVRLIANGVVEAPTLTESLMGLVSDPSGWIEENRLKSPWGVTVNDLNQIFVSDMDNNRIAVFDENGEFTRSFGQDYVNKPTGICIDNEGRIYVANRGDNKMLLFKTNYSPSSYLDLTRKNPSRKALVKLRISSHKLRIETGRYDNIPRDERLCNLCNCNRIEDETHFLLDCPSFSSIRDMFFSKLEPKIPFVRLQSHESLLSHLMNSTDYFINIQLISFISTCFELRDKLIPGIINPTDG